MATGNLVAVVSSHQPPCEPSACEEDDDCQVSPAARRQIAGIPGQARGHLSVRSAPRGSNISIASDRSDLPAGRSSTEGDGQRRFGSDTAVLRQVSMRSSRGIAAANDSYSALPTAAKFGDLFKQILSIHVDDLRMLMRERDNLCLHVRHLHKTLSEADIPLSDNCEVFANPNTEIDIDAYTDVMNSCSAAVKKYSLASSFSFRGATSPLVDGILKPADDMPKDLSKGSVSPRNAANMHGLWPASGTGSLESRTNKRQELRKARKQAAKHRSDQRQEPGEDDGDDSMFNEDEVVSKVKKGLVRKAPNGCKDYESPEEDEDDEATSGPFSTSCKKCGSIFMADAVFCRKCGHKRHRSQDDSTVESPSLASKEAAVKETPKDQTLQATPKPKDDHEAQISENEVPGILPRPKPAASPAIAGQTRNGKKAGRASLLVPGARGSVSFISEAVPLKDVESPPNTNGLDNENLATKPGKRVSLVAQMQEKQSLTSSVMNAIEYKLSSAGTCDSSDSSFLAIHGHARFQDEMREVIDEEELLAPLPEWCMEPSGKISKAPHQASKATSSRSFSNQFSEPVELEEETAVCKKTMLQLLIVEPNSRRRLFWDLLGMFCLVCDFLFIPMGVFGTLENVGIKAMSFCASFYWTLDMASGFFLAYTEGGVLITDFKATMVHYIRTWFFLDLLLCTLDWTVFILERTQGGSSRMSMGRLVRFSRAARALRLARLLKLRRIVEEIQDMINSEHIHILANLLKLVILLLGINHLVACMWYGIGDLSKGAGRNNWIEAHGFSTEDAQYRYLTALHWSLTQFTPASMHVQPQNSYERAFAIAVLVVALIFFSSFVSSITSSMTRLFNMHEDTNRSFWMLRRYLKENNVPPNLSSAVQRFCDYAQRVHSERIREDKVKFLSLLSSQLYAELQAWISMPYLRVHPLFEYISTSFELVSHRLFARATSRVFLAADDSVFFQAEKAVSMFFVVDGDYLYVKARTQGSPATYSVTEEDWVCEMALWMLWDHPGSLCAVTEGEVISVAADDFGRVVRTNSAMHAQANQYAAWFVSRIIKMDPWHQTDIGRSRYERTRVKRFLKETIGCQDIKVERQDSRSLTLDFSATRESIKGKVFSMKERLNTMAALISGKKKDNEYGHRMSVKLTPIGVPD